MAHSFRIIIFFDFVNTDKYDEHIVSLLWPNWKSVCLLPAMPWRPISASDSEIGLGPISTLLRVYRCLVQHQLLPRSAETVYCVVCVVSDWEVCGL